MHVVMATQHLADVGGSETYLYTVAENLVRLGHEVTVHAQLLGAMAEQVRSSAPPSCPRTAPETLRGPRRGRRDGLRDRRAMAGPARWSSRTARTSTSSCRPWSRSPAR